MNNILKAISILAILFLSGCTDITPSEQLIQFTSKVWNFFFSIGWIVIMLGLFNIGLSRTKNFILGVFILLAAYSAFINFRAIYSYPLTLSLPFLN